MRHLEGVAALPAPTASLGSPRRFALAYPRHAPRGRHDLRYLTISFVLSRPPPTCWQLKRAGRFCGASSPSCAGVAISATATSNRWCARRCSISQPHDVLEDNCCGGPAGPIFPSNVGGLRLPRVYDAPRRA